MITFSCSWASHASAPWKEKQVFRSVDVMQRFVVELLLGTLMQHGHKVWQVWLENELSMRVVKLEARGEENDGMAGWYSHLTLIKRTELGVH